MNLRLGWRWADCWLGWAGLGWAGRAGPGRAGPGGAGPGRAGPGWAGLGWAGLAGRARAGVARLWAGLALGWVGNPETEIGLFENGKVVSHRKNQIRMASSNKQFLFISFLRV